MEGEAMSEWQPIETAPKDGTRVILWLKDECFPALAAWIMFCPDDEEPGWYVFEMGQYGDDFNEITHWMPLPEPPKP